MSTTCLLTFALLATAPDLSSDGFIAGIVVNGTNQEEPVVGAKVLLRMKSDGPFALLDETETDSAGRFYFRNLLVSEHLLYLPGANHEGIHYPGPRVQLTQDLRSIRARVVVHDAIHEPNPLVVQDHRILIEPEKGLLRVTESLKVVNPTRSSYLGPKPVNEEHQPETLRLSISPDFSKVTFYSEFLGRNFAVREGALVTTIPWEPGEREIHFTYLLRNSKTYRVWERPLDLPTARVQVRVKTAAPDRVACDLERASTSTDSESGELLFRSGTKPLPAGHLLRVEMGKLPIPWMAYGRWIALVILAGLIAAGLHRRRKRSSINRQDPAIDNGSASTIVMRAPTKRPPRRKKSRRAA